MKKTKNRLLILILFVCVFSNLIFSQSAIEMKIVNVNGKNMKMDVLDNHLTVPRYKRKREFSIKLYPDFRDSLKITLKSGIIIRQQYTYSLFPKKDEIYTLNIRTKSFGPYATLKGEQGKDIRYSNLYDSVSHILSSDNKKDKPATDVTLNKNKGLSLKYTQTLASDSIRMQWLKQGGRIYYETMTFDSYMLNITIDDSLPKMNVYGFGITFSQLNFKLKVPDDSKKISFWSNFTWGNIFSTYYNNLKYDFTTYYTTIELDNNFQIITKENKLNTKLSTNTFNYTYSLNLGYTIGMNNFASLIGKGISLTVNYKPMLLLTSNSTTSKTYLNDNLSSSDYSSDATFNINPIGYGFDINFLNFSSFMNKIAPVPQFKLSVNILPPFGKIKCTYISVGIGFSTYYKVPHKHKVNAL